MIEYLTVHIPYPEFWRIVGYYSKHTYVLLWIGMWFAWASYRSKENWNRARSLTMGLLVAISISVLLRMIVPSERPFVIGGFEPLIPHESGRGFPSNHAISTAVFAGVFLYDGPRWLGGIFSVLAIIVGSARVIAGLHFPVDVVSGWFLGLVAGIGMAHLQWPRRDWFPQSISNVLVKPSL
ncbi:MAG: phosphatase PAP2 family protein [bacterium]